MALSVYISSKVWKLQGLTPTQKFVFISLADQANDEGVCWPAIRSVSKRTGFSDRAIRQAIKFLEQEKYLRVDKVPGRASNYVLTPARDAEPCNVNGAAANADLSARRAAAPAADAGQLETSINRQRNKKYKKEIWESAERLLVFFNDTCNKHHRGENSTEKIAKVLNEGFTEQECRSVIVRRWRAWKDDDKMKGYLRIGTVFAPTKFADYIGEIPKEVVK